MRAQKSTYTFQGSNLKSRVAIMDNECSLIRKINATFCYIVHCHRVPLVLLHLLFLTAKNTKNEFNVSKCVCMT